MLNVKNHTKYQLKKQKFNATIKRLIISTFYVSFGIRTFNINEEYMTYTYSQVISREQIPIKTCILASKAISTSDPLTRRLYFVESTKVHYTKKKIQSVENPYCFYAIYDEKQPSGISTFHIKLALSPNTTTSLDSLLPNISLCLMHAQ